MGKFEIIKSSKGYRFNLKSRNHRIILNSESYRSKASAEKGVNSVKLNAQDRFRFEELISKNDLHYFTLKASNGEIIGVSKMYTTLLGMKNGIVSVMTNASKAEITYIGFHEKVPVAKSTVNTVKVYPKIMPQPTFPHEDGVCTKLPLSHIPQSKEVDTIEPVFVAENPMISIAKNTNVEKESYEAVVLPKLKKKQNVFNRIIQSISRFFVGNV